MTTVPDSALLSPAGQPYKSSELLSRFASSTPRDMYVVLCRKFNCKPIGAVENMFPESPNSWSSVVSVSLEHTYVGPRGVLPIIELCKLLPNLTTIDMRDNYLKNDAIWYLSKMAMYHPALHTIDVSQNPISWTGAMALLELVSNNAFIASLGLRQTSIPDSVVTVIQSQVLRNAALGSRRHRRGIHPSNHPTTIRQRALKRYFLSLAGKHEVVHRDRLADGLKEMWKVSGREREITQRTPLFYENFCKRATQDQVTWEEFLLLIMLEDVKYSPQHVDRLRNVFQTFDVDGSGYVEVSELRTMMTQLSLVSAPPSDEELKTKMKYYDLDESMTLTWDEFLLLMYDHGPVLGAKAEQTATPLPIRGHALHF